MLSLEDVHVKSIRFSSEPLKYLLTFVLTTVPLILYYIFVARYMPTVLWILTIIFHALVTLVNIILGFIDPGIMRKNLPMYESPELRQIPINRNILTEEARYYEKSFLLPIKTQNMKIKFCRSCLVYRSPRTVHCGVCNACVDRFDHHCPWLGNCVGRRNYIWFYTFVILLSILIGLMIAQFILCIAMGSKRTKLALGFSIALLVYAVAAAAFVWTLFVVHTYLTANNMTTYECMKNAFKARPGNPFAKSFCLKNFFKVFCWRPHAKVDPLQPLEARQVVQIPTATNIYQPNLVYSGQYSQNYLYPVR